MQKETGLFEAEKYKKWPVQTMILTVKRSSKSDLNFKISFSHFLVPINKKKNSSVIFSFKSLLTFIRPSNPRCG